MHKSINLSVSEEEYRLIKELADDECLSVPAFVRQCVFPDDLRTSVPKRVKEMLLELPVGTEFQVPTLLGDVWNGLDDSARSSLGKWISRHAYGLGCDTIGHRSRTTIYRKTRNV